MEGGRYSLIAVYILASGRNGTLYTGVTSELPLRIWQHKQGVFPGFTRKYRVKRLVWYEPHASMVEAIQRERNIKHYVRAWKLKLIEELNPEWRDLSDTWFDDEGGVVWTPDPLP
jgi:putative endonuclease